MAPKRFVAAELAALAVCIKDRDLAIFGVLGLCEQRRERCFGIQAFAQQRQTCGPKARIGDVLARHHAHTRLGKSAAAGHSDRR